MSIMYPKRQKIGGTKVWQIWWIMLFSSNFICQLHKLVWYSYILAILDEFNKLSFTKKINWQIRQTLVPLIFRHLQYLCKLASILTDSVNIRSVTIIGRFGQNKISIAKNQNFNISTPLLFIAFFLFLLSLIIQQFSLEFPMKIILLLMWKWSLD